MNKDYKMLNAIIQFSLKNRLLVVAASALLMVYGVFVISKLPVDVFPDLNRPTVTIFTGPRACARRSRALVTWPLETAVNGSTGVERVRSASAIGLSIVWVEFGWDTNIYTARQIVAEKLQQAQETLPQDVRPLSHWGRFQIHHGRDHVGGFDQRGPKLAVWICAPSPSGISATASFSISVSRKSR